MLRPSNVHWYCPLPNLRNSNKLHSVQRVKVWCEILYGFYSKLNRPSNGERILKSRLRFDEVTIIDVWGLVFHWPQSPTLYYWFVHDTGSTYTLKKWRSSCVEIFSEMIIYSKLATNGSINRTLVQWCYTVNGKSWINTSMHSYVVQNNSVNLLGTVVVISSKALWYTSSQSISTPFSTTTVTD